MQPHLQTVFLHELQRQAAFGLTASADLDIALASANVDRTWYSVQALLVAVGNLSKVLWPAASKSVPRGQALRTLLNVPDSSPLAPRTFRNHFEHFDERLETWAGSSRRKNFADSNIGPPGMIQGLDSGDYLRNYDTANAAVTFQGEVLCLRPVVAALKELHATVTRELLPPQLRG